MMSHYFSFLPGNEIAFSLLLFDIVLKGTLMFNSAWFSKTLHLTVS